jgi:hypothetical protein
MLRTLVFSVLVFCALAASSSAGYVRVNFFGGNGTPLVVTLPRAVSFTVTNDTPSNNAVFVFQGVGNVLGGVAGATGSLSYTINGGSALAINSVGNISLGEVVLSDLAIFRQGSPSVDLDDTLLLASGTVATTLNIPGAVPHSGLFSAIMIDVDGTQLGVGRTVLEADGDFNSDGLVNAADYTVWRDVGGTAAEYEAWKSQYGEPGMGAGLSGVPEPGSAPLLVIGAVIGYRARSRGRHGLQIAN